MKEDNPFYKHLMSLPGMAPGGEDRVLCYMQSSDLKSFRSLFPKITKFGASIALPRSGGMGEQNTILTTPDGRHFFGVSYKGDVERWGAKLRACCAELGMLWAEIRGTHLILSNGESISLSDCTTQTYGLSKGESPVK